MQTPKIILQLEINIFSALKHFNCIGLIKTKTLNNVPFLLGYRILAMYRVFKKKMFRFSFSGIKMLHIGKEKTFKHQI